jgi:anti-sigma-K factor RskA
VSSQMFHRQTARQAQTRLPWWALALPALAFAALLALVAAPAHADPSAAEPLVHLLGRITQAIPDLLRQVL